MHKLNSSPNFNYLIGKEVIQVCIGLYQVILRFTDQLSITIESTYYISTDNGIIAASGDNPDISKNVVSLLGQTIRSFLYQKDNELDIIFSNGYSLKLVADETETESFSITDGKFEIVA